MVPETRGVALPGTPDSVGKARAWLDDHLVELGIAAETIEVARLIASELCTNAVQHSRSGAPLGCYTLSLTLHPAWINIEVTDAGGTTVPRPRPLADDGIDLGVELSPTGRGLALVDALATRWWTRTYRTGRTTGARIGR